MNKAKELFFNHNCSWTILHSKRKLGEYLSYGIEITRFTFFGS